ncbi:MAG: pentapeptide repeat-containing protein [Pseudomonadota bacterium]
MTEKDPFLTRLANRDLNPGEVLLLAMIGPPLILALLAFLALLRVALLGVLAPGDGNLRDYALILAAVLGAPFVIWRTLIANRQTSAAEGNLTLSTRRLATEQFTKAVELLGTTRTVKDTDGNETHAPVLEIRLGAIYSLERLARENKDLHIQIMELLCAYVRENAPASACKDWPGAILDRLTKDGKSDDEIAKDPAFVAAVAESAITVEQLREKGRHRGRAQCLTEWCASLPAPREDIRAILDVLSRRSAEQQDWEWPDAHGQRAAKPAYKLDLRATNLRRCHPGGNALNHVLVTGARMEGVDLSLAQMAGADLRWAWMEGADLSLARMEGAVLRGARMEGAVLIEAWMAGADLRWAWMEGAYLSLARMEGAVLIEARMEGADLSGARMEGADLSRAQMVSVLWGDATLRGASAHNTDVRNAGGLSQDQLDPVVGNGQTKLDPGLYVWTCLAEAPEGLDAALAKRREVRFGIATVESLRAKLLCGPGKPREKTGRHPSLKEEPAKR